MALYQVNGAMFYANEPHVEKNVFLKMQPEDEPLPEYEKVRDTLPVPVWEGHGPVLDCYRKVWSLAFRNLRKPKAGTGFVSNFIDTAFNDFLFMWDSSFIVMFGKYAGKCFDFQKTLDNFYSHQHRDGFICREICEYEAGEQWHRDDPASTGPNILPWAEWEYYRSTGDIGRIARVFDPLLAYHTWLRLNRSWQDGTYWSCGLACGMDNCPRQDERYDVHESHGFMSWIDICAQQYMSARILVEMAKLLGREEEVASFREEAEMLRRVINEKMWDEKTAFYYDTLRDGRRNGVKTVGSYWTLLAGLVPEERAERFVAHLDDEKEFKRPNRIPSLSADDPRYDPKGGYWRGGVWAPTNYMTLCGLHRYGFDGLAFEIARDYLNNVVEVFRKEGTVFENYAPEQCSPGFAPGKAKADFVGWTGLALINILFESVFGIHPDAQNKLIVWNVRLTEKHGILQYPFAGGTLALCCEARASEGEEPQVTVTGDVPVTVEVVWKGGRKKVSSLS